MNIELLLANFRNEMEKLYETINFEHYCGEICGKLEKFLNENSIKCTAIWGQYSGASLNYVPNIETWIENDEDFDEDEFWQMYNEAQENKKALRYAHWWIKTKDNYIIDITADQFHPDEKEKYKIVYTLDKKFYKEYQ